MTPTPPTWPCSAAPWPSSPPACCTDTSTSDHWSWRPGRTGYPSASTATARCWRAETARGTRPRRFHGFPAGCHRTAGRRGDRYHVPGDLRQPSGPCSSRRAPSSPCASGMTAACATCVSASCSACGGPARRESSRPPSAAVSACPPGHRARRNEIERAHYRWCPRWTSRSGPLPPRSGPRSRTCSAGPEPPTDAGACTGASARGTVTGRARTTKKTSGSSRRPGGRRACSPSTGTGPSGGASSPREPN